MKTPLATLALATLLSAATPSVAAQDTFSVIVFDAATGELASAGASCIDGDAAPGGARIISSVLPGVGAVHTQSFYVPANQRLAERLLAAGFAAERLLDSVRAADRTRSDALRQYAAVTLAPTFSLTGFTGASCMPYAGHHVGADYVAAGNILLDSLVLARMVAALESSRDGGQSAGQRALAALQAVAYPGADRRCLDAGLSSRSAFLRVARPGDEAEALSVDAVVEFPEGGRDPIDLLAGRVAGLLGAPR